MARASTGLVLAAGAALLALLLAGIWAFRGQERAPETVADQETATPAPQAAAGQAAEAPAAPAPAAPPLPEPPVPELPRLDVVRVDAAGLATIAGSAPPGSSVSLRIDGAETARITADAAGQFATLLTLPPSEAPRMLSLVLVLPDGREVAGAETVALAPVAAPAEVAAAAPPPAPAALLLAPEGVTVLQDAGAAPAAPPLPISVDSIAYGAAGEVLLGGRAAPEAALRIYLDDAPMAEARADAAGGWQARLAGVAAGLHVLRADEIDGEGKVLSRFETPFQHDLPEPVAAAPTPEPAQAEPATPDAPQPDPAPVAAPAPITITVQPGLTLWAIARENFGQGIMYVQVFEANRDKIKDPDLIYPGQVFTVPKP